MTGKFPICVLVSVFQSASASELLVASPTGAIVAGEETTLELLVWDGQSETTGAESLSITDVAIDGVETITVDFDGEKGVWVTEFRPPESGEVQITVRTKGGEDLASSFIVGEPFTERFSTAVDAGTSRAESLSIPTSESCGDNKSYGSSEGVWSSTEEELSWSSDTNRHPRLALVGVANHDASCTEVNWTPIRLASLVPVTVSTEPGTTMVVVIGGRSYGPVVADAEGTASVNIRVRPGEVSATASLMDPLGNSQETTIPTGGRPVPAMAILETGELRVGEAPPELHIAAISGRGRPYSGGSTPRCLGGNGHELPLREVSQGIWRSTLPVSALEGGFDYRVDCQLDTVHAAHRIPVVRGQPSRIRLRVYPTELSADFPVAEIEASLLDAYGDRILASGLHLSTSHGEIVEEPHSEVLRGDFVGEIGVQNDSIIAGWRMPAKPGPLVDIHMGARRVDLLVEVVVRALSSGSTVLAGETLMVTIGDQANEVITDSSGWGTTTFQDVSGTFVIRSSGGTIYRELIAVPSNDIWLDSSEPDLLSETELTIRNGNIRTIGISANPTVLHGGTGETAQITLRLLDRAGNVLSGNELELEATSGSIEIVGQNGSGEYIATYIPDREMLLGEVDITASTEGFSTSFGIRIVPRPQNSTLAVGVGWMFAGDPATGRVLALDFDQRLELLGGATIFRASYLNWTVNSDLFDSVRDRNLGVEVQVHQLSANLLLLRESSLVSTWFGGGLTLAPYRQRLEFEGEVAITGWGISQIGVAGVAGVGKRAYGGQIYLEGRWAGLRDGGGSVGYGGSIGGVAALAGFRLIL